MRDTYYKSGSPDEETKGCHDCIFLKAAIGWWCVNEKSKEERGTRLPGKVNCDHWEPIKSVKSLPWYRRIFKDFILIDL